MITWAEWVDEASGGETPTVLASKISVSRSSITTWLKSGRPPAHVVVAIARVYGADVVVGFVTAGILSEADVSQDIPRRLRHVPTGMLLAELGRRSAEGESFESTMPPGWSR